MFTRPVLSQPDLERVISALDNELDRILSGDGDDAHAPEQMRDARHVRTLLRRFDRLWKNLEEQWEEKAPEPSATAAANPLCDCGTTTWKHLETVGKISAFIQSGMPSAEEKA